LGITLMNPIIRSVTMKQRKTISFILCLLVTTFSLQGQQTLIHAGRLIDTDKKSIKKNIDILVKGNRIVKVGKSLKSNSATVIDLSDKTVLPGLIDGHTHICLTPDYSSNPPVLYKTNTYRTMEAFKAAKRILNAGFTTIRDVDNEGADMADIAVRDAINEGMFVGPRIFVSGWAISITGGHMNLTGLRPSIDKKVEQLAIIADNSEDMVAAIRDQRKSGVDFIKDICHRNIEAYQSRNFGTPVPAQHGGSSDYGERSAQMGYGCGRPRLWWYRCISCCTGGRAQP